MNKRILAGLFVLLIAGGVYLVVRLVGQQESSAASPTERPAPDGYRPAPSYTDEGQWYGFVTDSANLNLGYKATPEMIKKSIANGAYYVLYNPYAGRVGLEPPEKAAQYAGQQVWVTGTITSNIYGTGPTVSEDIEAVAPSNFEPSKAAARPPSETIRIISMTPTQHDSEY